MSADALPGKFIYLGTYAGGRWVTHYFDDYQTFDPTDHAGENTRDISIARDTQINVRHGVLNAATTAYPQLLCTVSGSHQDRERVSMVGRQQQLLGAHRGRCAPAARLRGQTVTSRQ